MPSSMSRCIQARIPMPSNMSHCRERRAVPPGGFLGYCLVVRISDLEQLTAEERASPHQKFRHRAWRVHGRVTRMI